MAEPTHRRREHDHFRLVGWAAPTRYQPPSLNLQNLPKPTIPDDFAGHATRLRSQLQQALAEAQAQFAATQVGAAQAPGGTYVVVSGRDGFDLEIKKLQSAGMVVLARPVPTPESPGDNTIPERAHDEVTVFIPDGKLAGVNKRLNEYATSDPAKPRHQALINRIGAFRRASLRSLWTDQPDRFPAEGVATWLEVWLRTEEASAAATIQSFRKICAELRVSTGERVIAFRDRVVVLAHGTLQKFELLMLEFGELAELRRAMPHPREFDMLRNAEQVEWANDLADRLDLPGVDAPAVCILDGGVNRAHLLLAASLAATDTNTVNAAWGTDDHRRDGHGTAMAGVALFGCELPALLASTERVTLWHRLESVKILPRQGTNPPELYGAVTSAAVDTAEAHAPDRSLRTFSMAVTSQDNPAPGEPTSWSAAVDALAAGRIIDPYGPGLKYDSQGVRAPRRLIVVSAGNVETKSLQHVQACQQVAVEDPGQAWNALTVGANSEKTGADIRSPEFAGSVGVAAAGDLSPFSATSVPDTFTGWPIKPEVLFEGGNRAVRPGASESEECDDLMLLTTSANMRHEQFTVTGMTSAATAQAARMAAMIQAYDGDLWPETVRALLVHSARWTQQMESQRPRRTARNSEIERFVRTFGFGVPDLERALVSARDALTMVCQDEIEPYVDDGTSYGHMNLYNLPWPTNELARLASARVVLRATLSYFIDPYPVRKEGERKARYPSTSLRFDFQQALDEPGGFIKRINQRARGENERGPQKPAEQGGWFLGPTLRHLGSLHQDIWTGTAAELAKKGVLAVWPVGGWMKDASKQRQGHERLRYALVVSLETETVDADLMAEVKTQIQAHEQVVAVAASVGTGGALP